VEKHFDLVGYTRVSSQPQDAQLQRDALVQAGCGRTFEDKISSRKTGRPGLIAALDYLRPGDTLCVWKLDRLGRSVKEVLTIADDLHGQGIALQILTGQLAGSYTPTGEGKFFFTMMAAFAELERDISHERTMAGLAAARAQGRLGGRPTVMDPDRIAAAVARRANGESPTRIAKDLGVSRASIYRHLPALADLATPRATAEVVLAAARPRQGRVHQLKVRVEDISPPIWRRVQLTSDATLAQLHIVLQTVLGWEDYHLHSFDGYEDIDEHRLSLEQIAPAVGHQIGYTYDFGDNWRLHIIVEKILARPTPGTTYPRCTAGRRNGPPEDSGGPYGYHDLLRALRARKGDRYRQAREQHGRYDAEAFDLAALNATLA
jgi:DNA invertase Pin-like site-specific DNA recombinase